jgi:hypothetical protein
MSRLKLYKHYIKTNAFNIKDKIKTEQKLNKKKRK